MGKFWIVHLGLGRHFQPHSAFHQFCRAQDIERRVEEKGGGFHVLAELQAAFKACAASDRAVYEEQAAEAAVEAAPPKRKAALLAATEVAAVALGITRSGKRFRSD